MKGTRARGRWVEEDAHLAAELTASAKERAEDIATSAIMAFIFSWNQFLFSLILSGPQTKTVPVAVYDFISYGKIDWAGIGAAATLIVLPVSVFAFFVRKTIVQGLTMGALKD